MVVSGHKCSGIGRMERAAAARGPGPRPGSARGGRGDRQDLREPRRKRDGKPDRRGAGEAGRRARCQNRRAFRRAEARRASAPALAERPKAVREAIPVLVHPDPSETVAEIVEVTWARPARGARGDPLAALQIFNEQYFLISCERDRHRSRPRQCAAAGSVRLGTSRIEPGPRCARVRTTTLLLRTWTTETLDVKMKVNHNLKMRIL